MDWILDGYNVIHAHRECESKLAVSLQVARDHLIHFCEGLVRRRGDFKRMLIVFDGKSEFAHLPPYQHPSIEVIYTESGEDADDRIIRLLDHFKNKTSLCVVSNDNYVINHARAYGAAWIDVAAFFDLDKNKKNRVKREKIETHSSELPEKVARHITEEYKKYLGME